MASLRTQQAGRDFASFDDDRKEGRYAPGHFQSAARDAEPLTDAQMAVVRAAEAQIEAAFGKFDRKTKRFDWSASAPAQAGRAAA